MFVMPPFALSQGVLGLHDPATFQACYLRYSGDMRNFPASLGGESSWSETVGIAEAQRRMSVFTENQRANCKKLFEDDSYRFLVSIALQVSLVILGTIGFGCLVSMRSGLSVGLLFYSIIRDDSFWWTARY